METKVKGFIFKKTEYNDNCFMLNALLENNEAVSFTAKGLNKMTSKNATACNYFNISEFVLLSKTENSGKVLKTANVIKQFHLPFDDLLVSSCFLLMYEVISEVHEQMDIYDLAYDCFVNLENKKEPMMVLNYFLKNVMIQLGYKPNLDRCIFCKKRNNLVSFSFSSGGFICKDCYQINEHVRYSNSFLKALYEFFMNDKMYLLEKEDAICLFNMFVEFYESDMGIHLNTADFLRKSL